MIVEKKMMKKTAENFLKLKNTNLKTKNFHSVEYAYKANRRMVVL